MKRNHFLFLFAMFVLSVGWSACSSTAKQQQTTTVDEKPVVKLAQVFERDVPQIVEFTATIQPQVKNSIAPATPGRIRRILVDVGTQVKRGQALVQMDGVNLENYQTQVNNLRQNYSRLSDLFQVGGVSKQDLENMKSQLDQAELSLKNMKENTSLVSPINGVVTARNYDDGDLFSGQLPVLTVMQVNPLKVIVNVSETYFPKVRIGMTVDIAFDVYPNERFSGTVRKVYPIVDEVTRTFGVEIGLSNGGNKIRPGMYARVKMDLGTAKHVVVPDLAVVKQVGSGARFVYVYNDGKVSFNKVELGQRMNTEYELISGVSTGSQVVVAGQSKLNDGVEVSVVKEE